MNGLISIIVPVYNTEKYLPECIESLINQTYKNIEIILVNDGSTDNSYNICREYAEKDRRIKVINKLNGGVSSARKVGILNANGDYVGFVDSDDYVSEKMYEILYSYINSDIDAIFSLCYNKVFNSKITQVSHSSSKFLYDMNDLNDENAEVYKKVLFKVLQSLCLGLWEKNKIMPYIMEIDERIFYSEDSVIVIQFIVNASKIYFINDNLYFYRKFNLISATTSKNHDFYNNINYYYKSLKKAFMEHKNCKILLPLLEKNVFDMSIKASKFVFDTVDGDYFFMFPYEKIKPDSKIIIYGIGAVGKSYYKQICKNNYCDTVMLFDENYDKINVKNGKVCSPEEIKNMDYDFILIANKNWASSKQISKQLAEKYCIDKEKIICHEPKSLSDIIFD